MNIESYNYWQIKIKVEVKISFCLFYLIFCDHSLHITGWTTGRSMRMIDDELGLKEKQPDKAQDSFRKLYNINEKLTRTILHSQDLDRYHQRDLIPIGLKVSVPNTAMGDNLPLIAKWEAAQHNCSLELITILIEHYDSESANISQEIDQLERTLYQDLDYNDAKYTSALAFVSNNNKEMTATLSSRKNTKSERAANPCTEGEAPPDAGRRGRQTARPEGNSNKRKRSKSNHGRNQLYRQDPHQRRQRYAPTQQQHNQRAIQEIETEEQKIVQRILI